ncbi:unnamed protein product [Gadus morhua 'NCC']
MLQKKDIDAVFIKRALQSFTSGVQAIRDQSSSPEQQQVAAGTTGKRRALGEQDKQRLSKEVCDTILGHANERFSFTSHLSSVVGTAMNSSTRQSHIAVTPSDTMEATVEDPTRKLVAIVRNESPVARNLQHMNNLF